MARATEFDACIVGSGAGGGAVAHALCKAGWKVVVLEKGPHYTEKDFFHDELTVCRRSFFVPSALEEPNVIVKDGHAQRSAETWISCCVGGGTVHMSGFFYRLRPDDLRLASRFGVPAGTTVADWPIRFEELEPHYAEVERTIGVSGEAPFPLPPIAVHPAAALVEEAARKLGLTPFPTPRAVLSQPYAGRKACSYCGFCGSYGCEVGAKSSSLATFLALAQASGRLTIRPGSMSVRVLPGPDGRARAVEYLRPDGALEKVSARVVVVAASAIQSARLLLHSGLANGSGLLGKNLMFAGHSNGWARFPLPHPRFAAKAAARDWPFLDRSLQDDYVAEKLPYPKAGTVLFLLPHYNPIFQAERLAIAEGEDPPVFGAALKRRLREFFHETRTIEWETFAEFLPHAGCDVTLDKDVKDRFGLPVARVRVAVHEATLAATEHLYGRGKAVLEAAGATRLGRYPDGPAYLVLQAGTARMGRDPARSVLDANGQAHEVKNLYVADGSGFPSAGGAPYTLTIMANALRVAAAIVARGKRGEI